MIGRTAWMLVAGLSLATACASDSGSMRESNEIQGKPPTPETDPFFYAARPPESAKAESTGMIGEADPPPARGEEKAPKAEEKPKVEGKPRADAERSDDVEVALRADLAEYRERLAGAEAALTEAESKNLDISARSLELESRLAAAESKRQELAARSRDLESKLAAAEASVREARAAKPAAMAQPKREAKHPEEAQCFSCVKICPATGRCPDDAELVCGWGKGKQSKTAMLRASSECDAALDVVRRAGQWSRVDGQCPPATCNAP